MNGKVGNSNKSPHQKLTFNAWMSHIWASSPTDLHYIAFKTRYSKQLKEIWKAKATKEDYPFKRKSGIEVKTQTCTKTGQKTTFIYDHDHQQGQILK